MTLPLQTASVEDQYTRRALDDIARQFPISPPNALGSLPTTGTTLPTGTFSGQDFYYQLSGGGVWHFKFNSTSAKWDFAGGPPLYVVVETSQATGSTSFADLGTVGPSVTAPFGGDYISAIGVTMSNNTANQAALMGISINGGAVGADDKVAIQFATGGETAAVTRTIKTTGLAATNTITAKYAVTGVSTGTFARRWLAVLPVQVS